MLTSAYHISTNKNDLDVEMIIDYLSGRSYWAKGRSSNDIKKSIEHSFCFGLFTQDDKQVGFARVISDQVVYAWLMDVFILEEYRGAGLGKFLMQEILNHPDLKAVKKWALGTKDAHGLYEQFGFKTLAKPENMMEFGK